MRSKDSAKRWIRSPVIIDVTTPNPDQWNCSDRLFMMRKS